MTEIKKLAFCSVFAALSIALMFFCVLIPFFSFSILGICGALLTVVYWEAGRKKALLTYFVVSVLAMFIVLRKFLVLCYVLFLGYYPVLKFYLEVSRNKFLRNFLRPVIFVLVAIISEICLSLVFSENSVKAVRIYNFVLVVLTLYVYDVFISAFSKYYLINLRHKFIKSSQIV